MLQEISISDEEILYSQNILLPPNRDFTSEGKQFIRNLNTIDLQAVPGSGKTTALLAKLLILEKRLPLKNNSGILVLSHTNTAIDEIKTSIQKYCPQLFAYPNFVGTIQSFVDKYLALPFYQNYFKGRVIRIDNEIYNEGIKTFFLGNFSVSGFSPQDVKNARYFINGKSCLETFYLQWVENKIAVFNTVNEKRLKITKPIRGKNYVDFNDDEKQRIQDWLIKFKLGFMKNSGILHFNDAYFLSDLYLSIFPRVKDIIQKRFSLVFVDEMQDMNYAQCSLLERLFFDEGRSCSRFQRIGDRNQSIFNGSVDLDDIWINRNVVLPLSGSQRLSSPIANVVSNFAIYQSKEFRIEGLGNGVIKPHIITYNDETVENVIQTFLNRINTLCQIPDHKKFKDKILNLKENGKTNSLIKVIAWNAEWKTLEEKNDLNKVRLSDYYKLYNTNSKTKRIDHNSLKSYLYFFDREKRTLEAVRKNILNALLKILRLELIKNVDGRQFTKRTLIERIQGSNSIIGNESYETFKLNIYKWSINIIRGEFDEVFYSIVRYIPELIKILTLKEHTIACTEFLNGPAELDLNECKSNLNNVIEWEGCNIEVTTVHAVKGQTHLATLYLESHFHADGQGAKAKSYESQRLADQFLGVPFQNTAKRARQSAKMTYVGFSRPTDFLCIAIHQDRFNQFLTKINLNDWEVIPAE